MKSTIIILLCLILITLQQQTQTPQLKVSISFQQINNIKKAYEQTIQTLITAISLDHLFYKDFNIPVIGSVSINASNFQIEGFQINWDETLISGVNKTQKLYIAAKDVSIIAFLDLEVELKDKSIIKDKVNITFSDFNFTSVIQFFPVSTGFKFYPYLQLVGMDIGLIDFQLEQGNKIINEILNYLVPKIGDQLSLLFEVKLWPKINTLLQQKLSTTELKFNVPLNKNTYNVNMSFTSPPYQVSDNQNLILALDLDIQNKNTSKVCPNYEKDSISDRLFNDNKHIELNIGSNLIDKLLWVLLDSEILNQCLTPSLMPKSKLQLTTSGLELMSNAFLNYYGPDKNMFICLQVLQNSIPNLYIRQGRIVGSITLGINFHVDKNGTEIANAHCSTCVLAYGAEVELFFSFNIGNINNSSLRIELIDISIKTMKQIQGEVAIDTQGLESKFGGIVNLVVPTLNEIIGKPINIPIVGDGMLGINAIDLTLAVDFISLALSFNDHI